MFEQSRAQQFVTRLPLAILIPLFVIVGVGIINLSSAANATRPDLYLNQLARFAFALSIALVAAISHTRIIRRMAYVIYVGAIVLLLLVLIMGTTVKGAERWLVVGAFRLQPSDPVKIAMVLAIARYCSLYWPYKGYSIASLIRPLNVSRPIGFLAMMVLLLVKGQKGSAIFSARLLMSNAGIALMCLLLIVGLVWLFLSLLKVHNDRFQFVSLIAPIDVAIVPFFLIAIEPDLGTSLIVLAVAVIMFLYVGIRRSSLIFGAIVSLAVGVFAYFTLLMDYQRQRIITFLNPSADVMGDGYHSMQSIIAIGSGRMSGKGYNGGTQTQLSFLPENATDFVFSVWAEEWGFLSCTFLLGIYFLLLWSILKLVTKVEDKFSQLVCVGVAANLFLHVIVNVGMVTGLMPVVGVPLPLMSYGGSSLTVTLISIGLVVNIALFRGEK